MLNSIWPILIIIGISFGISNGKVFEINNAIFNSTNSAIQIIITMFGTIALWNGIMMIASKTKISNIIIKMINPIMKKIFPDIKENSPEYKEISMNITANIMGLGNAATPLGLKAMKHMQKDNKNKEKLSNSMAMFILINTASLQIIPTTVIAIRNSLESNNPTGMIIPVWITTLCSILTVIIIAKILIKRI